MSNMSYCRFENTLRDLQDCANALVENEGEFGDPLHDLSREERAAAIRLIALCADIGEVRADAEVLRDTIEAQR